MPTLTFGVSGTDNGTYGTKPAAELTDTQTFGSWGAALCVILLVEKSNGDLFCGHMACDMTGVPDNQQPIITKATALLDAALGNAEKGQPWSMTTAGRGEQTSIWMRQAMSNWFTVVCTSDTTNCLDAMFTRVGDALTMNISNNMSGATNMVASNPFTILQS